MTMLAATDRLAELLSEKFHRQTEALKLFEPFEKQTRFLESPAFVRLMRGGQRSSKTLTCAIETARIALGKDPYQKYPTGRPLTIWCLAKTENHIGRVFWSNLFMPGAFRIIQDKHTGEWRTFRPWLPEDAAREKEARPAPPLIPKKCYHHKDVGWRDKKERSFSVVRLTEEFYNTEIYAFSGQGDPPTGNKVDFIWIDEDIENTEFIYEMITRLIDLKGRLVWSAFPHSRNDVLVNLSQMAEEQSVKMELPDVLEVHIRTGDNPYLSLDHREKVKGILSMDEDQLKMRDEGEFLTESTLMYPMYDKEMHQVPRDPPVHRIDHALKTKQIPHNWTRYISIDPGHSVAAALFVAVPPPEFGDFVIAYDEVYLTQASAETFVKAIWSKGGQDQFYAFIIDDHGARIHETGSGRTVRAQYSEQFRNLDFRSQVTGYGFINGTDDRLARATAVRQGLMNRADGSPRLMVLRESCPNFHREITRYKKWVKKMANGQTKIEDVADPKNKFSHAMNAWEYVVAYNPKWYPPPPRQVRSSAIVAYERLMDQLRGERGGDYVWLGPGTGVGVT